MSFALQDGIVRCVAFDRQFDWQDHGFGTRVAAPAFAGHTVTLFQVHSAIVRGAEGLRQPGGMIDRQRAGDALIASRIGCAVGIRTADCVPLLLLDARTRTVAAVHAGWRGTELQVVARTIARLMSAYGSRTDDLHAAIGPCIRACCYQVSQDVAARFERWPDAVRTRLSAKPHVNLASVNRVQMLEAGVRPEHIYDSGSCTACNLDCFFSYRRQPENPGRMISAIVRIT